MRGRLLEDRHRDLGQGKLLVGGAFRGDGGCIARRREVDTRVWHEVRLELRSVTIEARRGLQRRDDLV